MTRRSDMDLRQEEQPQYKIHVKMMKTMALDVKCTDTIGQIKSKISAIEGIDKSQQALFFDGYHLEDNSRLTDYNIMTNASVDLYVTDGIQISVNIPSAGKIIKLNLKKSLSVADVKAEVEQKGGIPLDEQILMYGCQQLEDNNVLSQCAVSNGQTLHVLVCPTDKLCISVNLDGERTMNLDVRSWYTIADVKLMIQTMEGFPACSQILMRSQPGSAETLEDTQTLQNQHIRNNDTLMLYQSIQFFVKTYEGKTLTLSMRTCDKTDDVMDKVEEKFPVKAGVYYLHYRGRVLCLGETLQKHKVTNNSTVDVCIRNSPVVRQNKKETIGS